jgi:hypothetical protein
MLNPIPCNILKTTVSLLKALTVLSSGYCRVVLENFSFITEEASAQEDVDWKSGPTRTQIKEIAEIFCRFSRSTEYMPLRSVVHSFILAIPPPLGLQVPASTDGTHNQGLERMLLRLIRAELNLALRHRGQRIASGAGGMFAFLSLSGCRLLAGSAIASERASSLFVNGVSFREVLTVLALWRNTSMMPIDVRCAHWTRMADVVRMACALVIVDFLRGAAARRGEARRHAAAQMTLTDSARGSLLRAKLQLVAAAPD